MSEPTPGELMRRIDQVVTQITLLAADLREDRKAADEKYLRRDVFDAKHDQLNLRVNELEERDETRARGQDQFRKQLALAFIAAGLSLIVAVVLATLALTNGATP